VSRTLGWRCDPVSHYRDIALTVAVLVVVACSPVPPPSPYMPASSPSALSLSPPGSGLTFTVTGSQAGAVALVVRFGAAFNAARMEEALALFAEDANVSDCDYASQTVFEAKGRAGIRSWLEGRMADHDRLVIGRIFNMNPDSDLAIGVEFALRSSDSIAALGAPNGLVPELAAKVVIDASGERMAAFANGPAGADPGDVRQLCSVPAGTSSPSPMPSE
jgi:hypothetical protein